MQKRVMLIGGAENRNHLDGAMNSAWPGVPAKSRVGFHCWQARVQDAGGQFKRQASE